MPDGDEVLVFYDLRNRGHLEGGFLLVPRAQVEGGADPVLAWRGPALPADPLDPAYSVQVLCDTVLVDRKGYFTCKNAYPEEGLEDEILRHVEAVAEEMANMRAAETWSEPWDELLWEYGDVYQVATFGDVTAVNGYVLVEDSPDPPPDYEEAPEGGAVPSDENYVDATHLAKAVHDVLADENARYRGLPREIIENVVGRHFPAYTGEIAWTVSGKTKIWVPRAEVREEAILRRRSFSREELRRRRRASGRRQDWSPRRRPENEGTGRTS